MKLDDYQHIYFIGIGGIGMSALARYFYNKGKNVAGYDRVSTGITDELVKMGISVHYNDDINLIPDVIRKNINETLVIYTPAIPSNHSELNYFKQNLFRLMKRAEVLGMLFNSKKGIAIAGTHGKTTTTTMTTHLLTQSKVGCSAFLGGISLNYQTNLIVTDSDYVVAEADEYDRSFLQLYPVYAVITSTDPDHLDIYGTHNEVIKAFEQFIRQIQAGGVLIYKKGIKANVRVNNQITCYTYSTTENDADFKPVNLRIDGRNQIFDLITPTGIVENLILPVPGSMNLENATAALAVAKTVGASDDELRQALVSFMGVKRRFEYHIDSEKIKLIDDYAHHPEELKACIHTAKSIYPEYKITGIFQPHLYSRTRDFATEFAQALDLLDEVILLDIYPARELPIEGVTSELIFNQMKNTNKVLCSKNELLNILNNKDFQVLITMGAGDIDTLVEPIKQLLLKKL